MYFFLLGLMCIPAALGALLIYHIARPQRSPADSSNRINKIRLVWFAMTREDELALHIPWLRRDEKANVKGAGTCP